MRFVATYVLALALSALLPSAFAQSGSWTVETLRLDGQQVAELPDVQRRDKGGEPFRRVSLQRGGILPEGAEIAVPARAGVDLLSPNGNRLVLYPGSRMVLLHASGKGERYQQAEGRVRFNVIKALDFFNVHTPEKFLASVKGTEYEVNLVLAKAIEFRVLRGAVEVERSGKIRVGQEALGEADEAGNIAETEHLSAGETKRYDLTTEQYLAQFKTYRDAEAYYRRALEEAERSRDRERIHRTRRNLGWILIDLSRYEDALRVFETQFKDVEQGSDEQAYALRGMGVAYRGLGDYAAAIGDYDKALPILQRLHGERDHNDIATLYHNLGVVYRDLNDFRRAFEYMERSLSMRQRIFGNPDHEGIAALYQNLGITHIQLHDYRRAITYFEQSLAMRKRLFGDRDHEGIAGLYHNLGVAYRNLNQNRKAVEYFEQGLAMRRRLFGEHDHEGIAGLYQNLGVLHQDLSEFRRAIEYYEQALMIRKRIFGERAHPGTAALYNNLGVVYGSTRDYRRSAEYHRLALEMYVKLANGVDDGRVVAARRKLADALQNAGDTTTADRLRAEASAMEERLKQPKRQ